MSASVGKRKRKQRTVELEQLLDSSTSSRASHHQNTEGDNFDARLMELYRYCDEVKGFRGAPSNEQRETVQKNALWSTLLNCLASRTSGIELKKLGMG